MGMLWQVNPKGRKKRRKLSAAQRAAGFGGKKHRKQRRASSRKRRRSSVVASAAPVIHRRRRTRRSAGTVTRRRRSGGSRGGFSQAGAINLLKAGVIGGAGAVAVDFAMGQALQFLPDSMKSPSDGAGGANYGYFGAKVGLALLLGTYGKRLPVVGKYAERMGEGALTVIAYQFLRPMAAKMTNSLGYFNPAPTQRPQLRGTAAYVSGTSAYASLPVRSGNAAGKGARAAAVLSAVGGR